MKLSFKKIIEVSIKSCTYLGIITSQITKPNRGIKQEQPAPSLNLYTSILCSK